MPRKAKSQTAKPTGREIVPTSSAKPSDQNPKKGRGRSGMRGSVAGVRVMRPRERRVMDVLLRESSAVRTNAQMAADAGVPERTFCRIKAEPWFRQQWQKLIDERLQSMVPEVLGQAFTNSKEPGREGHYDRRMLLTMAGLQTTANKAGENQVNVTINVAERLTSAAAMKEQALAAIEDKSDRPSDGPVIDAEWSDVGQE